MLEEKYMRLLNRLRFPTCSVNPLKKQRFGDFPNTKASLAPTKIKLLQKQLEACGIDLLQCNSHSHFFLFYSHTRELVFVYFQSQDFQFLFDVIYSFTFLLFSTWLFPPTPQVPDSPLWLCTGEREACVLTKLSDRLRVLISSALVSFELPYHAMTPPSHNLQHSHRS